jgi:hypothetical protein
LRYAKSVPERFWERVRSKSSQADVSLLMQVRSSQAFPRYAKKDTHVYLC